MTSPRAVEEKFPSASLRFDGSFLIFSESVTEPLMAGEGENSVEMQTRGVARCSPAKVYPPLLLPPAQ